MYRPEGWKNPYPQIKVIDDSRYDCYEAGADAMLEGLRKKGQRFGAAHNPFTGEWKEAYIQVSIPEDTR